MTNEAYILLWISSGLIISFFIAIVCTWIYGHNNMMVFSKIDNILEKLLSSYLHAGEKERESIIYQIKKYIKRSSVKKERMISHIIQYGDEFILQYHEPLLHLCEETGIKTFLFKQLRSKQDDNKALACRQLGDLRIYAAGPHISKLINSKNNNVVYNVLLALTKLGDLNNLAHILVTNSRNITISSRAVIEIVEEFKGAKEDLFKQAIDLSDDHLRGILIKAAAMGQYEGLSHYYVKYLNSEDVNVRIACLRALSELKNPKFEQLLIGMLEAKEWEVRAAAAKGLQHVGTSSCFGPLVKMASDKEWWVRRNAASTLVSIPGGKEYAMKMLSGKDQFALDAIAAAD